MKINFRLHITCFMKFENFSFTYKIKILILSHNSSVDKHFDFYCNLV